jgi:ectoine hydroxylase-related dioxygenase (phytanoyl-CoA dioxygenase family)
LLSQRFTWLREYVRFLSRMGIAHPMTFVKEFPAWNMYSFFPGRTGQAAPPPLLQCKDVEQAVKAFYRYGFVILEDGLTPEEASTLKGVVKRKADGILKLDQEGLIAPETKHGDKRYSFGEYGPSREWEYLAHNERVLPIVKAIWKGHAFRAITAGGDFVLPGGTWQPLHNDMAWKAAGERIPRVVIVNYYVSEVLPTSGPIRQVPGTARFPVPNRLVGRREPQWMKESVVTGKPGYAVIRDPRAWHGGTPNTSSEPRYMPNLEYILRDSDMSEIGGTLNEQQVTRGEWIAEFDNK